MPWTYADYPPSMKNMRRQIREKAIDIANALMEEGYVVGSAIPIAIVQARKWAESGKGKNRKQNYHVVPHPRGWAVRRANGERASFVAESKAEAWSQAIKTATDEGVDVIVHGDDGEFEDYITLPGQGDAQPTPPPDKPTRKKKRG